MSPDKIEVAGLAVSLMAIIAAFIFISQASFPAFTYAKNDWIKVGTSENVGSEIANFMWNYRSLDLLAQAIILFGAAAGCLAILREEREEKPHDRT